MVERELGLLELFAAVLAAVFVAREHVGAGKSDHLFLAGERHVAEEPEDGRNLHAEAHGPNFHLTLFNHFNFSFEQQLEGTLPRDNVQGFERRVEDQGVSHATSIDNFIG
jgi:hypothetical protein